MKGYIYLEDGRIFEGEIFGYQEDVLAEIVFNTSMIGYQEILTDPSYASQVVVMTYPLIGNYGVNQRYMESHDIHAKGFIVKEYSQACFHDKGEETIEEFLKKNRIMGFHQVDTRALTKYIRQKGCMKCLMTANRYDLEEALNKMNAWNFPKDIVKQVAAEESYVIKGTGKRIAAIDFGMKKSILDNFKKYDCYIKVFPPTVSIQEIFDFSPQGVFLSNGPGDPKDVEYVLPVIQECIEKYPVFGICLGHQLLSLSLGADTYKLSFGHRGGNHPVKDLRNGRIYMTSQNHGYAVQSIENIDVDITHLHVNDGTVEGIRHKNYPLFSVQFHPEAGPGPTESVIIFDEFIEMCKA